MSIKAMKLASEFNRYFTSSNGVDVPARVSVSRDEWRALFDAIQQAGANQPATTEPVVDVRCEGCGYMIHHREHMGCVRAAKQHTHPAKDEPVGYMNAGNIHELKQGALPYGYVYPQKEAGVSIPVYDHPAPGVPDADFDLICNAIDKADTITMEGDYMLDSDDCIAVVRVMQVLLSVRTAMLAAKEAP